MKPPAALITQYNVVWLLFTIFGSVIGVIVVAVAAIMILKARRRRSLDGERSALRHALGKTLVFDNVTKANDTVAALCIVVTRWCRSTYLLYTGPLLLKCKKNLSV